jgi:hypothetical protein
LTRLLAPVHDPSAYPDERTLFFIRLSPNVQTALPHRLKVPPSGFGYPLGGVSPSALGNLFSSPRSWASLFRALIRPRGRPGVSAGPSARALPYQTARLGNGAPAASAYEASSAFRAPRLFINGECGLCPPELRRLPGSFRRTWGEASPFSLPLPLFSFPPPKKRKAGASGGSFRRPGSSPLSRGAHLPGVPDRLSSATPLGREPVATYFFGAEAPGSSRTPRRSSERPIPPRLTGSGTSIRSH